MPNCRYVNGDLEHCCVQLFRKTSNSFDVWYIRNFLGYRCMNESSFSWRFCVCVVFMWTHGQSEIIRPHGLAANEPQSCHLCHAACHLWSLQQELQFRFQFRHSVRVGAVRMIFEVAPKEIIIGIHVRWTWWPEPPTSIRQRTATKHMLWTSKTTFAVCRRGPFCWENVGPHACYRNDLILQMLQVPLAQ
jgi:hypothetical protein